MWAYLKNNSTVLRPLKGSKLYLQSWKCLKIALCPYLLISRCSSPATNYTLQALHFLHGLEAKKLFTCSHTVSPGLQNRGNAGKMFPATFKFWQPHLTGSQLWQPNLTGWARGPASQMAGTQPHGCDSVKCLQLSQMATVQPFGWDSAK